VSWEEGVGGSGDDDWHPPGLGWAKGVKGEDDDHHDLNLNGGPRLLDLLYQIPRALQPIALSTTAPLALCQTTHKHTNHPIARSLSRSLQVVGHVTCRTLG